MPRLSLFLAMVLSLGSAPAARSSESLEDALIVQRCVHQPMPGLRPLVLRSDPRVSTAGRLIKGMYYAKTRDGGHAIVAFYIACDRLLEPCRTSCLTSVPTPHS